MNIEDKQEKRRKLKLDFSEMKKQIQSIENDIANLACPFEIGQRVISGSGDEEVIASIEFSGFGNPYSFKTFRLKKNGDAYAQSSYAYGQSAYMAKGTLSQ